MADGLIRQNIDRLLAYSIPEVIVEVAIIWLLIFVVYRFIRGTRAAGALKGLVAVVIIAALAVQITDRIGILPRLASLYDQFLGLIAIAMVVTFQPELRRALIRLGEAPFFRGTSQEVRPVIDAVVEACTFLSKNKFGAIIALERTTGLRETIETGRLLDANVSAPLLNSIFWPSNPLHDMGVVIRNGRIVAASVQFPLADAAEMPDEHLGTRHRAALGLAKVTDALIVVVSEETGAISLAEGRKLTRWLSPDDLREELTRKLHRGVLNDSAVVIEPVDAGANNSSQATAPNSEQRRSDNNA